VAIPLIGLCAPYELRCARLQHGYSPSLSELDVPKLFRYQVFANQVLPSPSSAQDDIPDAAGRIASAILWRLAGRQSWISSRVGILQTTPMSTQKMAEGRSAGRVAMRLTLEGLVRTW